MKNDCGTPRGMQSDESPVSVGPRTTLYFSAPALRTGFVSRGPGTPAEFIVGPPGKNVPGKIELYTPEMFGPVAARLDVAGVAALAGAVPFTVTVTSRVST